MRFGAQSAANRIVDDGILLFASPSRVSVNLKVPRGFHNCRTQKSLVLIASSEGRWLPILRRSTSCAAFEDGKRETRTTCSLHDRDEKLMVFYWLMNLLVVY